MAVTEGRAPPFRRLGAGGSDASTLRKRCFRNNFWIYLILNTTKISIGLALLNAMSSYLGC